MEGMIILDTISFESNFASVVKQTRVAKGTPDFDDFEGIWQQAQGIAGPKALYKPCFIDNVDEDQVFVGGTCLKSRLLRRNLAETRRIFPFVATCGMELCTWAKAHEAIMHSFYAETILQEALTAAIHRLESHIREKFSIGNTAVMTPGSLEDWPISEQGPLFEILGNIEHALGIRLTDCLMMDPVQSLSGVIFATEVAFESCQLCPRENCPSRRVFFDKDFSGK